MVKLVNQPIKNWWLDFQGIYKINSNNDNNWVVVSNIFYFHPYLGKIPILTNIFQRGWNHQLGNSDNNDDTNIDDIIITIVIIALYKYYILHCTMWVYQIHHPWVSSCLRWAATRRGAESIFLRLDRFMEFRQPPEFIIKRPTLRNEIRV